MDKNYLRTKLNTILQGGIRLCLLTSVAFTVTACYAPANPELDPPMDWGNDTTTTQIGVTQRTAPHSAEEQLAEMQSTHNATDASDEVQP